MKFTISDTEIRFRDTYNDEDIEKINIVAFIGTIAMVIVATIAKIAGVI